MARPVFLRASRAVPPLRPDAPDPTLSVSNGLRVLKSGSQVDRRPRGPGSSGRPGPGGKRWPQAGEPGRYGCGGTPHEVSGRFAERRPAGGHAGRRGRGLRHGPGVQPAAGLRGGSGDRGRAGTRPERAGHGRRGRRAVPGIRGEGGEVRRPADVGRTRRHPVRHPGGCLRRTIEDQDRTAPRGRGRSRQDAGGRALHPCSVDDRPRRSGRLVRLGQPRHPCGRGPVRAASSPHGVRLIIADVQGKGLGTVRCAAVVLAAFREAAPEVDDLGEVGLRIENALERGTDGERFVTGLIAEIDSAGHLVVFNHGHPQPLLLAADGQISYVESAAPVPPFGLTALAATGSQRDSVTRLTLAAGDRILFYTDGLSEARDNEGRFYPVKERAGPLVREGDPETALARLRADVAAYTGARPDDDSALLLVEFSPGTGATREGGASHGGASEGGP
ncbi:PP2C family protein-serine/threonine phosphatase [Streptomyces hydrogenans]|uniref:PP2C family protein-serine/threonine phosphatase n=1 Tax=Streptomyces hydrogenans TaxID=1873719 RepID=UPI0035E38C31